MKRVTLIIIVIISLGLISLVLYNGFRTKTNSELKTYENSNFSFQYPADWVLTEYRTDDTSGRVLTLIKPEVLESLNTNAPVVDPGYADELVIYKWDSINNEYAVGGSWEGKRIYNNLADYFSNPNEFRMTQSTGDIMIGNQKAYEVIIGGAGANYGIMYEFDGVYELSFETAWDKSQLSNEQKRIIDSFYIKQ